MDCTMKSLKNKSCSLLCQVSFGIWFLFNWFENCFFQSFTLLLTCLSCSLLVSLLRTTKVNKVYYLPLRVIWKFDILVFSPGHASSDAREWQFCSHQGKIVLLSLVESLIHSSIQRPRGLLISCHNTGI